MTQPAPIQGVHVRFRRTESGLTAMRCAGDCASRLNVPLHVLVHCDVSMDAQETIHEYHRVARGCASILSNGAEVIAMTPNARAPDMLTKHDALVVTPSEAIALGPQPYILVATSAPLFPARHYQRMCIPLGNGSSNAQVAACGGTLARALGVDVLLYHTTWRDPQLRIEDPRGHLHPDAAQVLAAAQADLHAMRVRHECIVETAERVTAGIIRSALRNRCGCIVMSRGPHTGYGSYVDQVITESPIPVLIIPTAKEQAS